MPDAPTFGAAPEPSRGNPIERGLALASCGDYEGALNAFDEAVTLGQAAAAVYPKAMLLFHLGRHAAVVDLLERLPVTGHGDGDLERREYLLRECAVRIGRHHVALSEEAIAAKVRAGLNAHRAGSPAEALTLFTDVLIGNPAHSLAWNNKAHMLMELGALEHALVCVVLAIRIAPGDGIYWCTLGEILARLGCRRQALWCFESSFTLDDSRSNALYIDAQLSGLQRGSQLP